jgi:uncharacterized protein YneF (UPF0154 family)
MGIVILILLFIVIFISGFFIGDRIVKYQICRKIIETEHKIADFTNESKNNFKVTK